MTAVHLDLGNQANQLLAAGSMPEMAEAASDLRLTALSIRSLLMSCSPAHAPVQMDPSLPDPEGRRAQLADMTIDVVNATDYLLRLLSHPEGTTSRLILAREFGDGVPDSEKVSQLAQRQLDARGAAVRAGTRLMSSLRSDVVSL
jgi:hypothetical protein